MTLWDTRQGKCMSKALLKNKPIQSALHKKTTTEELENRKQGHRGAEYTGHLLTATPRLCHNVYIRIKTLALLFNGSEPN